MASCDSQQGDGANNQKSHTELPRVVMIDPDGDLILVVGSTKSLFVVCSKTLSRSAPFWKRCLYGPFREAKPDAGQDWVVEFPEDNPSAMEFVLLLAHALGHKLPEITLQLAFEVTVLTNKYDMTRLLWAVAGSWLRDLQPTWPGEGKDDTIVPQLQWLWVTKELGDSHQYSQTFAELALTIALSADGKGRILLNPYQAGDGTALTKDNLEGYDAEKDLILLIAEEIKPAREKAVHRIQVVLNTDILDLERDVRDFGIMSDISLTTCSAQNPDGSMARLARRKLCGYAMEAIVSRFSSEKDSALKPVPEISLSVEEYLATAVSFKSRIETEINFVACKGHEKCTPFISLMPSLRFWKGRIIDDWRMKNVNAFEIQAQTCGLKKGGNKNDDKCQKTAGSQTSGRKRAREES